MTLAKIRTAIEGMDFPVSVVVLNREAFREVTADLPKPIPPNPYTFDVDGDQIELWWDSTVWVREIRMFRTRKVALEALRNLTSQKFRGRDMSLVEA